MTGRRALRPHGGRWRPFTPGTTYDLGSVDSGPQNGTHGRNGERPRTVTIRMPHESGRFIPDRAAPPARDYEFVERWFTPELVSPETPRDRAGWWALCGFLAGLGAGALAAAGVILR